MKEREINMQCNNNPLIMDFLICNNMHYVKNLKINISL